MRKPFRHSHPAQKRYLYIVLMAMVVPSLVFGGCLYFLAYTLTAKELEYPDVANAVLAPAFHKINLLLIVAMPVLIAAFLALAQIISNRLTGPLRRIETELDEVLDGKGRKTIVIRNSDVLSPLVARINRLIAHSHKKQ